MKPKPHRHNWFYPHMIWQGRNEKECAIGRYCSCGATQAALVTRWQAVPRSLKDLREKLAEGVAELKPN